MPTRIPTLDETELGVMAHVVYHDIVHLLRDDVSDEEWNLIAKLYINFRLQRDDGTFMAKVPIGWTLPRTREEFDDKMQR